MKPSNTPIRDVWALYCEAFHAMFPGNHKVELSATALQEFADLLRAASSEAGVAVSDSMVDRFMNWPLPDSVCSDPCATKQGYPGRIGTNLLTADQARAMLEHVLQCASSETATLEMARALTRAADFLEAHDKPTLARDCRVCADVLAVMEDKK